MLVVRVELGDVFDELFDCDGIHVICERGRQDRITPSETFTQRTTDYNTHGKGWKIKRTC